MSAARKAPRANDVADQSHLTGRDHGDEQPDMAASSYVPTLHEDMAHHAFRLDDLLGELDSACRAVRVCGWAATTMGEEGGALAIAIDLAEDRLRDVMERMQKHVDAIRGPSPA